MVRQRVGEGPQQEEDERQRHQQLQEVRSGGGYDSQSDFRLHFGLGQATAATIEVAWPSGVRQVFHEVSANKFYVIEEARDQLALQQFAEPRRRAFPQQRNR